jgi:4-amino-4-deoxy-L-arabinose transferase-like glycosyltransferase
MWFNWTVGFLLLFRIGLFIYFFLVDHTFIHLDSGAYIDLADNLLQNHVFSMSSPTPDFEVQSEDRPYGPEVFRTPGFPVFLALLKLLGMKNLLWVVFWQEIIYLLSVYLFYQYGRQLFDPKIAKIGVVFLMLNPGGIAYTKLVLSETLFMPFVFGSLFAIGFYFKKKHWKFLLFAAIIMGIGALIRPIMYYFPWVAAGTILFFYRNNKQRWLHTSAMLLTFVLVISPWLIRNYQIYGQFFFSGQASNVLVHYHVPRVWNAEGIRSYWDGRPFIRKIVAEAKVDKEKQLGRPLDTVEFFKFQQKIALEELVKYPKTYLTQWISGTLKAMYVPFAVEVYNVYHKPGAPLPFIELLPDTLQAEKTNALGIPVFSETSIIGKLFYFVTHAQPLYLLSIITSVLSMIFALLGVFYIFQKKNPFLWLIMLANFYYISVAGPTGYARFRFPIDVFWFIQAIWGGIWCWNIGKHFLASLNQRNQPINAD